MEFKEDLYRQLVEFLAVTDFADLYTQMLGMRTCVNETITSSQQLKEVISYDLFELIVRSYHNKDMLNSSNGCFEYNISSDDKLSITLNKIIFDHDKDYLMWVKRIDKLKEEV